MHEILDPRALIAKGVFGATDLGTLDNVKLNELNLSAGDRWFRFQPAIRGILNVVTDAAGDVEVELFDDGGQPVEQTSQQQTQWDLDAGRTYFVSIGGGGASGDEANTATVTLAVVAPTTRVVDRHIFYNHSAFDGDVSYFGNAIATDKAALLPGETATLANYTSYSRGINGIMIDVAGLAGTPTAEDFEFRLGNNDQPDTWTTLDVTPEISVSLGAGTDQSDRVTIVFEDYAVRNQWLQVKVLGGGNTGLAGGDVFYFGNAVGEAGNSTSDAAVTATDLLLARNNPRSLVNPATVESKYDFNRDGKVNTTDVLLARNHQTNFLTALRLIDLSESDGNATPAAADDASGSLAWLAEYEASLSPDQSSGDRAPAADAVDLLLATF